MVSVVLVDAPRYQALVDASQRSLIIGKTHRSRAKRPEPERVRDCLSDLRLLSAGVDHGVVNRDLAALAAKRELFDDLQSVRAIAHVSRDEGCRRDAALNGTVDLASSLSVLPHAVS